MVYFQECFLGLTQSASPVHSLFDLKTSLLSSVLGAFYSIVIFIILSPIAISMKIFLASIFISGAFLFIYNSFLNWPLISKCPNYGFMTGMMV